MPVSRPYTVLFLCDRNATRSIMAECALTRWGNGRFRAFSAGWDPAPAIHPLTFRLLRSFNYPVERLKPRDYAEFFTDTAPVMDFVFIVGGERDNGRFRSDFPGSPMLAHWPIDDPDDVQGPDERRLRAHRVAYIELETRCKIFASLRVEGLDQLTLQAHLERIGAVQPADETG